jgi:uncharacterized membrane protein YfcA
MLTFLVLPMSLGSVAGALLCGYLAAWTPTDALKIILAAILAISAVELMKKHPAPLVCQRQSATARRPRTEPPASGSTARPRASAVIFVRGRVGGNALADTRPLKKRSDPVQ